MLGGGGVCTWDMEMEDSRDRLRAGGERGRERDRQTEIMTAPDLCPHFNARKMSGYLSSSTGLRFFHMFCFCC